MVDECGIQSCELFAFNLKTIGCAIQKGKLCEVDLYILPLAIFVAKKLWETKHLFLRETSDVFSLINWFVFRSGVACI
jgi:hypothetical protein